MTVFDMLDEKYRVAMKTINRTSWQNLEIRSKETGVHPAEIVYMGLEITENDIRKNGGWAGDLFQEIDTMHKAKLLASNKHRQAYRQVTKYWLTKKGWRAINKDHAIC